MARNLMIIDSSKIDWIFLQKNQKSANNEEIISYRHVICQALHRIKSEKDCEEKLKNFYESFKNKKPYTDESFFELYFFVSDRDPTAAVLIDRTKGCYPLILDSYNNRQPAFAASLKNIVEKYKEIKPILRQADEWTRELQDELEKYHDSR